MNIKLALSTLQLQGYLTYTYNPFYNFYCNEDLYLVNDKFLVPKSKKVNPNNGKILHSRTYIGQNGVLEEWVDDNEIVCNNPLSPSGEPFAKAGTLLDLDTDKLNFDLNHPVDITIQPSYDGSVNLILNDGKNIPRLINSRFSVREKNTFEIVDRIGENDTNIYSYENFDKDTSLYFLYLKNPTIKYDKFVKGQLQVGLYCFYLTYCDSDDNESDYIAESGLIPIFLGINNSPRSIDGGIKNQQSDKGIQLILQNLDKSYNYLKIYYIRYFADYNLNRVYEGKKIILKYPISSNYTKIQITGIENTEDIDPNILNLTKFNPKNVLTQTQCKNMLFFGNIVKNTDNYRELLDCALRILPELVVEDFPSTNSGYSSSKLSNGYYDVNNIYNKVGYSNLEYYRFGVVFIYNNGTLSNVYNTSGYTLGSQKLSYKNNSLFEYDINGNKRNYIEIDDNYWVVNLEKYTNSTNIKINSKGVCKIQYSLNNFEQILGIKFNIPYEVKNFLKNSLGIRGLFFVRQKRIPNILAQCIIMPYDNVLRAPIIQLPNNKYASEGFLTTDDKKLSNDYSKRLIKNIYESSDAVQSVNNFAYTAICPDYLLNLPYFNLIFNGSEFYLSKVALNTIASTTERYYQEDTTIFENRNDKTKVKLCSVCESSPSIAIDNNIFKLEIGEASQSYRFGYACKENQANDNSITGNEVRGIYSPYLAISTDASLDVYGLYNIYSTQENSEDMEIQIRMNSSEGFYAISDRYNFEDIPSNNILTTSDKSLTCYRGDCYINVFTYRLNRNFNDVTLPNNDYIINPDTFKNNYPKGNFGNIIRSDVNAVKMGSWFTFHYYSPYNYALRSEDNSYVSEKETMGSPRTFYPRKLAMYEGTYKMPDSYLYNDAYRASLGYKTYFTLSDINYIKNTFSNRIQYSAVAILDSFKNNYRDSLSVYFKDYSTEYGGITKLVESNGNIVVIFEHGIGVAIINERALIGNGEGLPIFINTQNVLPEELTILTDTYGTQWSESVIKTESGNIYGVDTVAKKIWKISNNQLSLISDFKVNKFLVNNITLEERETNPLIGVRNVKTHYNNNKKDVMFTFYDNTHGDEEKAWNLCYNELLDLFVTFYSWIPSYSENIDTQFFSFNRNTSKILTLLKACNFNIKENSGILLDSPLLLNNRTYVYYRPAINSSLFTGQEFDPKKMVISLEKDHWRNYELFRLGNHNNKDYQILSVNLSKNIELQEKLNKYKCIILVMKATYDNEIDFGTLTVVLTTESIIKNNLTTDFYLHGSAGNYNFIETWRPTFWYGELHPFEFEFIVNDNVSFLKIFNNLVIISNKTEPESIHFEIEGDNYDFSLDKRVMYYRQENTKKIYQELGLDIVYDNNFSDVSANVYTLEEYYKESHSEINTIDGIIYWEDFSPVKLGESNTSRKFLLIGNSIYGFLVSKIENGIEKLDSTCLTKVNEGEEIVYYLGKKFLYNPTRKIGTVYQGGEWKLFELMTKKPNLVRSEKSTIFPLYYEKIDTYNDIFDTYYAMDGKDKYDFSNLSGSEISWNRQENQFNIITHIKNNPIDRVGRLKGNSRYKEGKWEIQIPSIVFCLKNEDWTDIPPIVINSLNIPNNLPNTIINHYPDNILPNTYIINQKAFDNTYIDTGEWSRRKETRIRDKWIKIRIRYSGKNLAIIHSLITLYDISYS